MPVPIETQPPPPPPPCATPETTPSQHHSDNEYHYRYSSYCYYHFMITIRALSILDPSMGQPCVGRSDSIQPTNRLRTLVTVDQHTARGQGHSQLLCLSPILRSDSIALGLQTRLVRRRFTTDDTSVSPDARRCSPRHDEGIYIYQPSSY